MKSKKFLENILMYLKLSDGKCTTAIGILNPANDSWGYLTLKFSFLKEILKQICWMLVIHIEYFRRSAWHCPLVKPLFFRYLGKIACKHCKFTKDFTKDLPQHSIISFCSRRMTSKVTKDIVWQKVHLSYWGVFPLLITCVEKKPHHSLRRQKAYDSQDYHRATKCSCLKD